MKTLFILNNPAAFSSCREHIGRDDALLLIEDAVIVARQTSELHATECLVLADDLAARGISVIDEQWQSISYQEFVEKALGYDKSVSWL